MASFGFIQRAIKFGQKGAPLASQRPAYQEVPEAVRVSFSLAVYAVDDEADGWPSQVKELRAGQCYRVVITCEQSRYRSDVGDATITGDFKLKVLVRPLLTVGRAALHQTFAISYREILAPGYEKTWLVTIPEDLPSCDLAFSLTFWMPPFHPKEGIASCRLPVLSETVLVDTKLLDACNIDADLPDSAAVLAIASENVATPSDGFTVQTTNRYIRNRFMSLRGDLIVGVAQRFPEKATIPMILDRIRTFSRDHADELVTWLREFHNACQQRQQCPCLIVVDTTGAIEIPWELLEIAPNYTYLGAVAQIVRWFPFKPYGVPRMLMVKEEVYEGSILAYLDENMRYTEHERQRLQLFQSETLSSLKALRKRLRQAGGLKGIALVDIISHGQEGKRMSVNGTGDRLQQPDSALRSLELVRKVEHPEPRPIFFSNSCDSARMLRTRKNDPTSFAESFLVQCASSYIGTMAPVSSSQASIVGDELLRQAGAPEGVQPVEALRVMRAQVVAKMSESDRDDEAQKELDEELFFTSMYVYYGNPLARLRLLTMAGEKEGA